MTAQGLTDFDIDPAADPRDLRFVAADPHAARTLTVDDVEHYNRRGFVSPLPCLDGDDLAAVQQYFGELIETVVGASDRRNSYSINAYHLVCAGVYDMVLRPRILDYVEDIIGPDFICWGTQVFCKLPGDPKEIPLHQDATYWPFTPTKSVTVWLALDDVDADNAAMTFAPGSHIDGPQPHELKPLDGTRVLNRAVVEPERFPERHVNAMPAGSLSLHSDLLLHGSPANRSSRRRAGLTMRYTAAEVECLSPWDSVWLKPVVHCRGDIPPRWPHRRRPDGEHPEKMAAFTGTFDGNLPDAG